MSHALLYPKWPGKPRYCNPDSYMFSFSKVPDQGDARTCHRIGPTPIGGSQQLNQNHTCPLRLAPDVSQAQATYPYHCYQPRAAKCRSAVREGVSIVLPHLRQIVERNLPSGTTTHQEHSRKPRLSSRAAEYNRRPDGSLCRLSYKPCPCFQTPEPHIRRCQEKRSSKSQCFLSLQTSGSQLGAKGSPFPVTFSLNPCLPSFSDPGAFIISAILTSAPKIFLPLTLTPEPSSQKFL